ncbi:MAG TPA: sensor histidine kinase [Burkholderiaceae bacterium]|nr:sensor histidine kinase [Burkholderiaceae bacterium]
MRPVGAQANRGDESALQIIGAVKTGLGREENAIRHATSRVRLDAHSDADKVVIAVRDDGPGMTQEQQARAFDRFYRGTSDSTGAGLGLALVKRVAELHGGSVQFAPGLDGRGIGVELRLPDSTVGR